MKKLLALVITLMTAFLSACSLYTLEPSGNSGHTVIGQTGITVLPAPKDDSGEEQVERVELYFVSSDRQRLTPISRTITIRENSTLAGCMIERLLGASSSAGIPGIAPKGTKLKSVEESGGVIIVNLSGEAASASSQDLFWLKSAITNTLVAAYPDKRAHVLIMGREMGNSALPTGILGFTNETLQTLWAKRSSDEEKYRTSAESSAISREVAVYYPTSSPGCVMAQVRSITINGDDIANTVLKELYKTPNDALCLPAFSEDLSPLDVRTVELTDGTRAVRVKFDSGLWDAIEKKPFDVKGFFASITTTLCRAVPDVDGVLVQVGNDWLFKIQSDGVEIAFPDGFMRPDNFPDSIADAAALYFGVPDGGLARIMRAMPEKNARSARALVMALIAGPVDGEYCEGLFPEGLSDDDIIGIGVTDRAALINLSSNLYVLCQNISFARERNLVYSIVNTLCEMDGVNRAHIYIEGENADTLADYVSIKTDLLPNPGLANR